MVSFARGLAVEQERLSIISTMLARTTCHAVLEI
jgi:hypothetical protein